MNANEIEQWLREEDEQRLARLWRLADGVRRKTVGDEVHLRGLVEFSNICARQCAYCGLRAGNTRVSRYQMTQEEILSCARQIVGLGYGTIVLQSGENPAMPADWLAEVVARIKAETPLAVTLSVGERATEDYARWRAAGADRYLLRFETSDRVLFESIHPHARGGRDRIAILRELRGLGYETGSGVMIGIPGQTYASLAADIERFAELDLDMIGCGPWIAHPGTPLAVDADVWMAAPGEQVPATEGMAYKVIALSRLVCPRANIPATTALATLNPAQGRELGLQRGANIVMPNVTPAPYREQYEIYPGKACIRETADDCKSCLDRRIASIGRIAGTGRGDARRGCLAPDQKSRLPRRGRPTHEESGAEPLGRESCPHRAAVKGGDSWIGS